MGWNIALEQYATAQRAAGRAKGTIRLHRHYLTGLAEVVTAPWRATAVELLEFMGREEWQPETRKSARSSVRGFYRWGHGMGYVEHDPSDRLPSVTVPASVARPTPEHLVKVLAARSDRLGFMAMLAAYCGLRAGEIARLHSSWLVGDSLVIPGKGGKERAVPVVHRGLLVRLRKVEGWAFPNGQGSHLSPGHVSRLLSEAMPEDWTAHTLRHRCASTAYAGTRDMFAVQELLGHSRPETTRRYVRLPDDAVRAAVAAASA
ncbi:tyrosine-type recombinase/integrase [Nocardioides alcanivorans]|uniref:tyrosine-type recombinase/integrase n=1 Tax=Nocardioides alcanivorans TaxID=2897352 RepID=UPI001F216E7D|nr:tyrosine-type recombinase/integrase [Nocardioides alcanivorans]